MTEEHMRKSDSPDAIRQSARSMTTLSFRTVELYVWIIVALAISGRVMFFLFNYPFEIAKLFRDFYWDIVVAGLVLIFPVVFRLIFAQLPLEYLRAKHAGTGFSRLQVDPPDVASGSPILSSPDSSLGEIEMAATPAALLFRYATNSRQLATGIYGRAGVYLLVGVLVAFSGLVFFYTQTGGFTAPANVELLVLNLVPRFGILFFIELIAFFFLRQYRSAMDEFRYFEAVARTREEVVALIHIAHESGTPVFPMELVKHDSFFSKGTILGKGQSSEILEARKIEKSEIDLLEKVVDTLVKVKK